MYTEPPSVCFFLPPWRYFFPVFSFFSFFFMCDIGFGFLHFLSSLFIVCLFVCVLGFFFVFAFSLFPCYRSYMSIIFCLVPEGSQSKPVFELLCGNAANFSFTCTQIHSFIHSLLWWNWIEYSDELKLKLWNYVHFIIKLLKQHYWQ